MSSGYPPLPEPAKRSPSGLPLDEPMHFDSRKLRRNRDALKRRKNRQSQIASGRGGNRTPLQLRKLKRRQVVAAHRAHHTASRPQGKR